MSVYEKDVEGEDMHKGKRYDLMTKCPQNDKLGFFQNYEENMKIVRDRIRDIKPKKIFDIGCGTCNLSGSLSKEMNVLGIDKSKEMLEQARIKYPSINLICEDIDSWMEKSLVKKDELVVSSFVFHSIEDKRDLFKWLCEIIENKSIVLILDYLFQNEETKKEYIHKLKVSEDEKLADIIEKKYYLKIDELISWAKEHGFNMNVRMLTHWIGLIEIDNQC